MPKVAMCTAAEADQMRADLTSSIEAVDAKIAPVVEGMAQELRAQLQQVADSVTQNAATSKQASDRVAADSKSFTESNIGSLRKQLSQLLKDSEDKTVRSMSTLDEKIRKVDSDVRTALAEELGALCEQLDQQMQQQREELEGQTQKWAREAAEEVVKQRKEVDASIEAARGEAKAHVQDSYERTKKETEERFGTFKKSIEEAAERSQRAEGEVYLKLGQLEDELKELQVASQAHTDNAKKGTMAQISKLREDAEARFDSMEQETTKLRDAVAEVENLSTRRVDWVIKNVSRFLRPTSPGTKASLHTSWFSPKFNMAGAHGLQLEFQLYRPSDPPVDGEGAGDCAVFLWACKGTSMVYKLFIGKKAATLEKVFNGRVPYGTKRLCFMKDQINREDDTLRISVEVLETVREIEHPVKPPPPPTDIDELETAVQPLEGMVVFRRHVNNRLIDQVKREVEIMRSRMVRRIEWRVEQASLLRRCFPPGESMCSASFNAAGIEGMQLMFYPCGYSGASEGMCSVYLFAPAGTTLKCALYAGSQRRDASHFFQEQGAFGRTNFCRFDSAVDTEEDTITLALDVEEAHQDVQATVAHPVVQPGDRRSQAQLDGDLPDKVESVVKLKRVPGKVATGMQDRRVLPNMWQAKSLSGDTLPEGFHSFDELNSRVSTRMGNSPVVGTISTVQRSESTPLLKTTNGKDGELMPLPSLSRTGGSDWAFDTTGGSLRPGRKGRLGRKDRTALGFAALTS